MSVFSYPDFAGHEQVVFGCDEKSGLRAIVGIHNTNLGPALGGTRFWSYTSEQEAITDVLRLSKGMTYKAAVAGLPLGGGKAVIIGDPRKIKTRDLLLAYGRLIDRLGGNYITAEDVGTSVADMDTIREVCHHVRGRSDGTGDPSPFTAFGTYCGIKAAAKHKFGNDDLKGLRIAVQGLGHVGYHLCKMLHDDGAVLSVTDIAPKAVEMAVSEFSATAVGIDDIYDVDAEIFAPCALGAVVNDRTIADFKFKIIAGAANNVLAEDRHGDALKDLDILYAPDYVINAGGLINVASETPDYDPQATREQVAKIADTLTEIFTRADARNLSTNKVADLIAEERFNK